jgi:hypothetical protein
MSPDYEIAGFGATNRSQPSKIILSPYPSETEAVCPFAFNVCAGLHLAARYF